MENSELKNILIAYKSTNIGLQQAHNEILNLFSISKKYETLTPSDIVEIIIYSFNISMNDIKGKSRREEIRLPRQIIHTMLCIFTELTERQISLITNNNRAVPYNSYKTIYQIVKYNLRYVNKIINIFNYIKQYNIIKIDKKNINPFIKDSIKILKEK